MDGWTGPEGADPDARAEVRAFHRRIRHAGHRPHPQIGRVRISPFSTWSIPASGSRPSRARSATSRRRSLPAIVRVPSKEYHHIARACDAGAEGLMLPMVGTPDEVAPHHRQHEIPPAGGRAGSPCRSPMTTTGPAPSRTNSAAPTSAPPSSARSRPPRASRTPMPSRPSIGVDCLWVGHFDLSVSLGIPGEFDDPKIQECDRAGGRGGAPPRQAPSVASCRPSSRASRSTAWASISSAIPAMSGCSTTRWRQRWQGCGPAVERL